MRKLLFCICAISTFHMQSQSFVELANIGYGIGTGGGYDEFGQLSFSLKAPLVLDQDKNNVILLSFSGSQSNVVNTGALTYELGNLTFNPAFVRKLNDRNTLTLMSFNRWNNEKMGLKSDGYQAGGLIVWAVKKKDTYTYRIGFYANDEMFGLFVSPFFGVDWKISERLRLYGNLPILFTLAYTASDRIDIGLDYFGLISSFRTPATYIERRVLNLGPYADIAITKQLFFRLHGGYLVGSSMNEFALGDQVDWALNIIKFGDQRTELSNIDVKGFLFTGSLSFRISTE